MREINHQELSDYKKNSIKNWKRKINLLIISLLIINLVLFYSFFIFHYYLPNSEETIKTYTSSYFSSYLTFITIIILIRIIITIYIAYFFFNRWISRKKTHYMTIPFLFGLFFYFLIIGKLLDLMSYIKYTNPEAFPNLNLLDLLKVRYLLGIITTLPLFLLGIYLYLYKQNLELPDIEAEKNSRTYTLIFSIFYIIAFLIIIIFAPTVFFIQCIIIGLMLTSVSFLIWIFLTAHRGKVLSEINCLLISIGFIIYITFHIFIPVFALILYQNLKYGEGISVLILEMGFMISSIIILIGFKIEAPY